MLLYEGLANVRVLHNQNVIAVKWYKRVPLLKANTRSSKRGEKLSKYQGCSRKNLVVLYYIMCLSFNKSSRKCRKLNYRMRTRLCSHFKIYMLVQADPWKRRCFYSMFLMRFLKNLFSNNSDAFDHYRCRIILCMGIPRTERGRELLPVDSMCPLSDYYVHQPFNQSSTLFTRTNSPFGLCRQLLCGVLNADIEMLLKKNPNPRLLPRCDNCRRMWHHFCKRSTDLRPFSTDPRSCENETAHWWYRTPPAGSPTQQFCVHCRGDGDCNQRRLVKGGRALRTLLLSGLYRQNCTR